MRPGPVGGERRCLDWKERQICFVFWSFVQLRWIEVKCLGHIFVGRNLIGEKTIEDLFSWGINQPVFVSFLCNIRSWHTFSTFVQCVFRATKHRQKTPSRTAFVYIGRSRADVVGFFGTLKSRETWVNEGLCTCSQWQSTTCFLQTLDDKSLYSYLYTSMKCWICFISQHRLWILPGGQPRFSHAFGGFCE